MTPTAVTAVGMMTKEDNKAAPAVPTNPAVPAIMPVVPAAEAPAAVEPSIAAPVVACVKAYSPAVFIPRPVAAAKPVLPATIFVVTPPTILLGRWSQTPANAG